jgi:hypothetical protein
MNSRRVNSGIRRLLYTTGFLMDNYAPIIAASISVVGVFVGIYVGLQQFKKQQDYNRDQLKVQSEQELKRKYWEEQIAIYKEACDAVATIASAVRMEEVQAQCKTFWRLYWGRMSLIENQAVAAAMISYGKQLKRCEKGEAEPSSLEVLAWDVANSCRESLKETWNPVGIETLELKPSSGISPRDE